VRIIHFVAIVALTAACAIGGYFVGREHVKYELREAMKEAAERIAQTSVPPRAANRDPAAPADTTRAELIAASLASKTFHQSDPRAGDFQDVIEFSIVFENRSGKDIRAYDGDVTFTDLLDNKILSAKLAVNDPLKAGAKVTWSGGINYNQFMAEHRNLRAADPANLKMSFEPRKILYVDGSTQDITR
jgi:hypothetical protein